MVDMSALLRGSFDRTGRILDEKETTEGYPVRFKDMSIGERTQRYSVQIFVWENAL